VAGWETTGAGVDTGWLLVGFTWIAYCLNYSDRQVIFSIFPILKSELHFTDAQLGLTSSAFLWVYGLCSPIAGQIGDRFSKRRLVALSLLLWSGVTALTGFSHSVGMVLTCRALTGVTESLFVPAAVALLANAHRPENRSRAFAALCERRGLRHLRTRPYTPCTNGKAERFIQTLLREWAYRRAYATSRRRTQALPAWLRYYNERRPHTSLNYRAPFARLQQASA